MAIPQIGDIFLGRYRLLEEIGGGAYTIVFRAEQIGIGRDVAVKLLTRSPSHYGEQSEVARFRREVQLLATLRHPNTLILHDAGRHPDTGAPYFVTEYVDGRTLEQIVREDGPFDAMTTLQIARQMLCSLREAHAYGVIHRDIKPSNIMVFDRIDERNVVKVLDFGLARIRDAIQADALREELTPVGEVLGTPRYMAPELLKGIEAVPATDLFAVGLVLYEMLAAKPAIAGDTPMEVLATQFSGEPPVSPDDPAIPRPFVDLLLKATQQRLDHRFASADGFLYDLSLVEARISNTSSPSTPAYARPRNRTIARPRAATVQGMPSAPDEEAPPPPPPTRPTPEDVSGEHDEPVATHHEPIPTHHTEELDAIDVDLDESFDDSSVPYSGDGPYVHEVQTSVHESNTYQETPDRTENLQVPSSIAEEHPSPPHTAPTMRVSAELAQAAIANAAALHDNEEVRFAPRRGTADGTPDRTVGANPEEVAAALEKLRGGQEVTDSTVAADPEEVAAALALAQARNDATVTATAEEAAAALQLLESSGGLGERVDLSRSGQMRSQGSPQVEDELLGRDADRFSPHAAALAQALMDDNTIDLSDYEDVGHLARSLMDNLQIVGADDPDDDEVDSTTNFPKPVGLGPERTMDLSIHDSAVLEIASIDGPDSTREVTLTEVLRHVSKTGKKAARDDDEDDPTRDLMRPPE